jgi:hypothetical protein
MSRGLVVVGLCLLAAPLAMAACGTHPKSTAFANPDGGGVLGGGDSGGVAVGEGGSPMLGSSGPGTANCSGLHCSSDLHSVVDCDNNVVTACPSDQGCSGTSCVAACDSAKANKSSLGCEYYAVDPDVLSGIGGGAGGCFVAYIANTWDTPVTLSVDYGGMTLDASKFAYVPVGSGPGIKFTPLTGAAIPTGQVAAVFLADVPGANDGIGPLTCPPSITPAIITDAATHGTGLGKAFHLSVTAPVAAFDIYPYGGGQVALTSATLLLPTSAWDTNYIAVTGYGQGAGIAGLGSFPFVEIVAQQDNTTVTINPVAAITAAPGVAGAAQGMPTKYILQAGQELQFTQAVALDGSIIQSDNPVGVWGGKTTLSIEACCDESSHQQIPPVRALGSEYAAVRYRNRYEGTEESPPWRIIGAANGTVLTYDPSAPPGAPTTLNLGQVTSFDFNGPFTVRSQDYNHPFYMSAHMTGGALYDPSQQDGGADNGAVMDGRGDAEFVNIVPPGEYLQSYIFFTDPTYPETDLVLVRTKGPKGFQDVTLDCAGTLTGWQPIGNAGNYEYTRFDLVTGNFVGTGSCNNGRHEIHSDGPFGVTVWGWGSAATGEMFHGFYTQYVSYAYPAGAGVAPINTVVVPAVPQ